MEQAEETQAASKVTDPQEADRLLSRDTSNVGEVCDLVFGRFGRHGGRCGPGIYVTMAAGERHDSTVLSRAKWFDPSSLLSLASARLSRS